MEKKYLNGNLEKKIAYGLCWLPFISWIGALILLIVDKETLDLEDKRELVSIIATTAIALILAATVVLAPLGIIIEIVMLVNAILYFVGKDAFKMPGAYQIACAIIK